MRSFSRRYVWLALLVLPSVLLGQPLAPVPAATCSSADLSDVGAEVLNRIASNGTARANSPVPFPLILSTCNRFDSLRIDGPDIFRAARDIIALADHEVDMAFFQWDADTNATRLIGDGLLSAQARRTPGSPLLVRIVIDDDVNDFSRDINHLWDSQKLWVTRGLDTSRVVIQLGTSPRSLPSSPNLHDKIIAVDGKYALVTGSQPQKLSDPPTNAYVSGWHDTGYVLEGDVARSTLAAFEDTWTGDAIHWECMPRPVSPDCQERTFHFPQPDQSWLPPFGSQRPGDIAVLSVGRIKGSTFGNDTNNPQDLAWLTLMDRATSRVDIESPNINDDAFRAAVVRAVGRGVTVRLLTSLGFNDFWEDLPSLGGDNMEVVGNLRKEIRASFPWFQDRFQVRWYSFDAVEPVAGNVTRANHTKYMTMDDRVSVVGSGNQDTITWNIAHEFNVLIDSAAVTAQLQNSIFNPDWNRSVTSYLELYEGNDATQDVICPIAVNRIKNLRFSDPWFGGDFPCNNDDARSVLLHDVPAGKVLRFYDDPDRRYEDDDWIEIIVKRAVSRKYIDTFEQSFEDGDVRVIFHRNNGLDGKISSAEVRIAPIGAVLDLYQGNNATQNLVCSNRVTGPRTIELSTDPHCSNDAARSLVLYDFPPDKVIFVYDSPGGSTSDDWTLIVPKRTISQATVGTFESSFENADVRVCSFPNNGLDGKVSRIRIGTLSEAAGMCGVPIDPCDDPTCLPPLPPADHPIDFGYYYVDGKYGDYRDEVNCYTNIYYALAVHNYFSDIDWWPLFQQSLQNASDENRRIHLNLNWDVVGGEMGRLLDMVAPFWSKVVRIEMQDEPGWSRAETESNIAQLRSMLDARGLEQRPIGVVYTQNQIRFEDAIFANGLDWVGLEAYVNPPGSGDSQDNVNALNDFLNMAKARVPASKDLVLVMQAYDRNGAWTNIDTLRDLQAVPYLHAYNDPRVVAITMFSYARPGGSRDHPELKVVHRQIAEAIFGLAPGTCVVNEQPPTDPPIPGGPQGCISNLRPTFTWSAVDGATRYRIVVIHVARDWIAFNATTSGLSYTPPTDLLGGQEYRFKVRAVNSAGGGPWSDSVYFHVLCDFDGPYLLSAGPGCLDTLRPTFTWGAVPGARDYRIVVAPAGTDDFFISEFPAATSFTPSFDLQAGLEYRWKVKGRSETVDGTFSRHRFFTPMCSPNIGTPSPLAPWFGAQTANPIFNWEIAHNAESYDLVVTAAGVPALQESYSADLICSVAECSVTPSASLGNGTYLWQVFGRRGAESGPGSPGVSFGVSDTPSPLGTPTGFNVVVLAGGPVTTAFELVGTPGTTIAQPISPAVAGPLPVGFAPFRNMAFDVSTTAQFFEQVTVTFAFPDVTDAQLAQLRIFHREVDLLVNRTSGIDFAANTVSARVSSLSPFVIAELVTNHPPVARCTNVEVPQGANGMASVPAAQVNAGSSDEDGDPLSYSLQPPGPFALGTHAVVLTVTDNHGASSSCSATVTVVDRTAPATTAAISPQANAAGWHSSDVTVTLAASDNIGGSGVMNIRYWAEGAHVIVPTTVNGSTATFTISSNGVTVVSYTARDVAGNVETTRTLTVRLDKLAPATQAVITPQPNAAGWHKSDVTITLTAADNVNGSGVSDTRYWADGAQVIAPTTVNGSNATLTISANGVSVVSFAARDVAGNVETTKTLTIRLDKLAPNVVCAAADGVWHAADVNIACTASDLHSGLADATAASFNLQTNVPADTETANAITSSPVVCDVAGNCATAGPIAGNRVDKKAPAIVITLPASANYTIGQVVLAAYACSDGGSGVKTCTGTVATGAPIDTSSAGPKVFTVSASDQVGNASSGSVSYVVTYAVCAQFDKTKPFKGGSDVHVLLQICDAVGRNLSASSITLTADSLIHIESNTVFRPEGQGKNADGLFRFVGTNDPDPGEGAENVKRPFYRFDLKSPKSPVGDYRFTVKVSGDPVLHDVQFVLR